MHGYDTFYQGSSGVTGQHGQHVFGVRWRWTTLIALGWPIMLTVGAFLASGTLEALSGDQGLFVQVTSIAQRVALLMALVSGALAVRQRYRRVHRTGD